MSQILAAMDLKIIQRISKKKQIGTFYFMIAPDLQYHPKNYMGNYIKSIFFKDFTNTDIDFKQDNKKKSTLIVHHNYETFENYIKFCFKTK